jgi:hypothetical protein
MCAFYLATGMGTKGRLVHNYRGEGREMLPRLARGTTKDRDSNWMQQ